MGVFASPSVGFLIGWPVAAFVTGLMMERTTGLSVGWAAGVASVIGGILVLYVFGSAGLMLMLDKNAVQATGLVAAFVPGDLVKAVVAALITASLAKARPASLLSRAQ